MKTRAEKIEEFLRTINVENLDVLNCVDTEEVNSYDDVYEAIEESGGFDVEIIYYSAAMEYLSDNDNSLSDSLELAEEMGYSVGDLSSEVLASLLATQKVREDFSEYSSEIENFFDDLEDEDEDEE